MLTRRLRLTTTQAHPYNWRPPRGPQPGDMLTCRKCGSEFRLFANKPGRIDDCPACATDVERLVAADSDPEDYATFAIIQAHLRPSFGHALGCEVGDHVARSQGGARKGAGA